VTSSRTISAPQVHRWLAAAAWLGLFAILGALPPGSARAQAAQPAKRQNAAAQQSTPTIATDAEYVLGPGDSIRIAVFQNPDLTLEARVSETGAITYPLIGAVKLGGLTISAAEKQLAKQLKDGGFIVNPQISILLLQVRGSQVDALGQLAKPGRYPVETAQMKLADLIAMAGGIAATGSDTVIWSGTRDGQLQRREIDVRQMFATERPEFNPVLQGGDVVFVDKAPVFYIYGEVQKPGALRLERDMTLMQALAAGGGLTPKGTQRGVRVHRRGPDGKVQELTPGMDDKINPDDVVYVRESLF